jgi:hypothetical protein
VEKKKATGAPRRQWRKEEILRICKWARSQQVRDDAAVAKKFNVPNVVMVRRWMEKEDEIKTWPKNATRAPKQATAKGQEYEMEVRLNNEFEEVRGVGMRVDNKWLCRHAKLHYGDIHPERVWVDAEGRRWYNGFLFSAGWMRRFINRWGISWRASTKRAQKSPAELRPTVEKWLQYNRRMTVVQEGSICGKPRGAGVPTVGRFKLSEICNIDQTPIPFETSRKRTYHKKGDRTIYVRERPEWARSNCTVWITVYADAVLRTKALIIFRGPEKEDRARKVERERYHPDVRVVFNEKGAADRQIFLDWITEQYAQDSQFPLSDQEPRLLVLDAYPAHVCKALKPRKNEGPADRNEREKKQELSDKILAKLKELLVTRSLIPGGCTGYVQVCDILFNKLLKDFIKDSEQAWIEKNMELWENGKLKISERRIQLTEWIAQGVKFIHDEYADALRKTFCNVGLALPPNGSRDRFLKIKGMEGIAVGNWRRSGVSASEPEIGRDWVKDPDIATFVSRNEEHREVIEISDDSTIEIDDPMDDSDSTESGDDNELIPDVGLSRALFSSSKSPICIDPDSEDGDISGFKAPAVGFGNSKGQGTAGWDGKGKGKEKELIIID